jgi:hypothetical protein
MRSARHFSFSSSGSVKRFRKTGHYLNSIGNKNPLPIEISKRKENTPMKSKVVFVATMLVLMCGFGKLASAQAVGEVRGPIWISVSTSAAALQKIEVKAPAAGNMTVTVTGTLVYEHTLGTAGSYCLQLSQTSGNTGGCVPDGGSDSAIRNYIAADFPTTVPGFGASEQYSIVRTWPVTAGTNYTFYLNGYESGLTAWLFQPAITVLYVPGTLAP